MVCSMTEARRLVVAAFLLGRRTLLVIYVGHWTRRSHPLLLLGRTWLLTAGTLRLRGEWIVAELRMATRKNRMAEVVVLIVPVTTSICDVVW